MHKTMRDLLTTLETWRARGDALALATVVKTSGAAPRPVGAKMLINARGEFAGSVSGGCVEGAVIEAAQRVLRTRQPQLLTFGISDDVAHEVGLACGGTIHVWLEVACPTTRAFDWLDAVIRALHADTSCALLTLVRGDDVGAKMLVSADGHISGEEHVALQRAARDALDAMQRQMCEYRCYADTEIFIDVFAPRPHLVILGAVHIAIPLTQLAQTLGFRVTIVDGRARFANRERFPTADEIIVAWHDEALARLRLDASPYVAILTHDPKFDLPALTVLARATPPPRYIGMLGARATLEKQFAALRAQGVPDEFLARVHGPIGLDLGAQTPEEIALAILAEMIAVRYGRRGGLLSHT
jgi:xanthine dehydrogenase accessory factor